MNELKVLGRERVGQIKFTGIEGGFGENKKAMLVKDIAQIHGTTVGRINELINRNIKRFKNDIDFMDLKVGNFAIVLNESGFNQNQINATKNIYLLSERGYAKLLKILEDDKAWEIYDTLVDNYFNMRTAIKDGQPEIIANKRLEIMEENLKTRKATLLYKIAMATTSETSKQSILANATKELTGHMGIPVMKKKEYSATEIGQRLGISANKVGRISNSLGLKAEQPKQNEYGRWGMTNANGDRPTWLYFEKGFEAISRELSYLTKG